MSIANDLSAKCRTRRKNSTYVVLNITLPLAAPGGAGATTRVDAGATVGAVVASWTGADDSGAVTT